MFAVFPRYPSYPPIKSGQALKEKTNPRMYLQTGKLKKPTIDDCKCASGFPSSGGQGVTGGIGIQNTPGQRFGG